MTIRGEGQGGPNQEYALALALALDGAPGIAALSADTDGTDGGRGEATDPAGAMIDPTTLARAAAAGLDAGASLGENDSTPFFDRIGDSSGPGPPAPTSMTSASSWLADFLAPRRAALLSLPLLALLGAGPARADLRMCNMTGSRIGIALGYRDSGGWVTEGWWNLSAKGCETLLKGALAARFYYVFAVDYDAAASGAAAP